MKQEIVDIQSMVGGRRRKNDLLEISSICGMPDDGDDVMQCNELSQERRE